MNKDSLTTWKACSWQPSPKIVALNYKQSADWLSVVKMMAKYDRLYRERYTPYEIWRARHGNTFDK